MQRSVSTVAFVFVALVLLLLAQALGIAHRYGHGLEHRHGEAGSPGHAIEAAQHPAAALASLFDHDDGDTECRLLDALTAACFAVAQPVAVASPLAASPAPVRSLQRARDAPDVRAVSARGPPASIVSSLS